MEVEGAEEADDAVVGTTAPLARRAGAWNSHDDAAVAGILAAARAAGASGASVRYGGVVTKVWFEPQGTDSDQAAIAQKMTKLQLATAQARWARRTEQRKRGSGRRGRRPPGRQHQQLASSNGVNGRRRTIRHQRKWSSS